jgi:hypothetical protein
MRIRADSVSALNLFMDPAGRTALQSQIMQLDHDIHLLSHNIVQSPITERMIKAAAAAKLKSPKLFYQAVNTAVHGEQESFPTQLRHPDGRLLSSPVKIMDHCVHHFVSVASNLDLDAIKSSAKLLPHQLHAKEKACSASAKVFSQLQNLADDPNLASNRPLDFQETLDAINSRKLNVGIGPLLDSYELFKHAGENVAEILHLLFSCFFSFGVTPELLQRNLIKLIHKKGDKDLLINYRPITLSSSLLKIYETVLFNRVLPILQKMGVPSYLQHACRPQEGALDAVAELVELSR